MESSVTQRFITCYDVLRAQGQVRSARQFAKSIGCYPQSWNDVIKGRRKVTLQVIEAAVKVYGFNAEYLFTGEGAQLHTRQATEGLRVLTVVTDTEGTEKIVHVPEKAQAGYVSEASALEAVSDMMSYTVPGLEHRFSTFRSFEVAGDSMQPTLEEGDVVICHFVEPAYWQKQIKEDHVYVVVTDEDVVVKRIKNRIEDQDALHLHSDNVTYEPILLRSDRVRELWMVERVIRQFDHKTTIAKLDANSPQIDELLRLQSAIIERMGVKGVAGSNG